MKLIHINSKVGIIQQLTSLSHLVHLYTLSNLCTLVIDSTLSHQKITPHNHNLIIISLRLSHNDNDLDGDDDVDYDEDMRMMMMIKEMIMTMALMVVITTLILTDHLTSLSYFQGFERQGLWREGMGGVY